MRDEGPDRDDDRDDRQDELLNVRARVHRLADTVQHHAGKIVEHHVQIETLSRELAMHRTATETGLQALRTDAATKGDVRGIEQLLSNRMESAHRESQLKLQHISEKLEPLTATVQRVAWTVVLAVLGAVLTFVLRQPEERPQRAPAVQGER